MAAILVDYENVFLTDGLKGAEYLTEKDTLLIFYSKCCEKIRAEYIEVIEQSKCTFRTCKLARVGKNALDFYIAAECGCLVSAGEHQICIISKDKGFFAVKDFFRIQTEQNAVTVCVAPTIEKALSELVSSEDVERKQIILEKMQLLNIDAEQARIREHQMFLNKIVKAFEGTVYEKKIDTIIKLIEERNVKDSRFLYTGSLHEFGREDGRAIYRILKNAI